MNLVVGYASRHGATAGTAERIAAGLRLAGLQTEASSVTEVGDATRYDAFVIGDFRDWPTIGAWASKIAADLAPRVDRDG